MSPTNLQIIATFALLVLVLMFFWRPRGRLGLIGLLALAIGLFVVAGTALSMVREARIPVPKEMKPAYTIVEAKEIATPELFGVKKNTAFFNRDSEWVVENFYDAGGRKWLVSLSVSPRNSGLVDKAASAAKSVAGLGEKPILLDKGDMALVAGQLWRIESFDLKTGKVKFARLTTSTDATQVRLLELGSIKIDDGSELAR